MFTKVGMLLCGLLLEKLKQRIDANLYTDWIILHKELFSYSPLEAFFPEHGAEPKNVISGGREDFKAFNTPASVV
jgi:hypothetical protein